ncbi:TIGR01212 family radical SAM protein [Megalodesulfovibrio paquesii]
MPYLAFAAWLRRRHGRPVRKIPLDIGGSCPNRNPATNTGGCSYCNARGSGTGLHEQGLSLREQWQHWVTRQTRRAPNSLYLAYLQSFSNTFRPAAELRELIAEIIQFQNLVAIAVGTRPDCLDDEKLDILARARVPALFSNQLPDPPGRELDVWLELGMQSAADATLIRINRGHDVACLCRAARAAAERGLLVCLHVMHGLPGEKEADFLHTIDVVNTLPVQAVKFHNTLVLEGSALAGQWRRGEYFPPAKAEVIAALAKGIARLRPDIVVQRLTADAWPGELLAPDWAADKPALRAAVVAYLQTQQWVQGTLLQT